VVVMSRAGRQGGYAYSQTETNIIAHLHEVERGMHSIHELRTQQ
jgi:hypothetical protein